MLFPACITHFCEGIGGIVLSTAAGPCCCLLADCTSSRILLSCVLSLQFFHVVESLQEHWLLVGFAGMVCVVNCSLVIYCLLAAHTV